MRFPPDARQQFGGVRDKHERALRRLHGVGRFAAIGYGEKLRNGKQTGMRAIVVGVPVKKPPSAMATGDLIPKELDGLKVDVIQSGEPTAILTAPKGQASTVLTPGDSIGHYNITAGTLGGFVADTLEGDTVILSNNHVLADQNHGEPGDPIYSPGKADGGTAADTVAYLRRFVPMNLTSGGGGGGGGNGCRGSRALAAIHNALYRLFGRTTRLTVEAQALPNYVDAAVAEVFPDIECVTAIPEIGEPGSFATEDDEVVGIGNATYGRTEPRHNTGVFRIMGASVTVNYGSDGTGYFRDQLISTPISEPGDSGSLVILQDGQNTIGGLLFAGSDDSTIVNPAWLVKQHMGVA